MLSTFLYLFFLLALKPDFSFFNFLHSSFSLVLSPFLTDLFLASYSNFSMSFFSLSLTLFLIRSLPLSKSRLKRRSVSSFLFETIEPRKQCHSQIFVTLRWNFIFLSHTIIIFCILHFEIYVVTFLLNLTRFIEFDIKTKFDKL